MVWIELHPLCGKDRAWSVSVDVDATGDDIQEVAVGLTHDDGIVLVEQEPDPKARRYIFVG
jgi:hypothetical protein